MRTIQTDVYKYAELSDSAKEKARDWFRTISNDDYFFSECVIEGAATIAELFGLDIRQTRKNCMDGSYRYEPTVYWSGFWSQGDGAAFDGNYKYKKGALKAVKEYAPQDAELRRIVKGLCDIQKKNFYRLTAKCTASGWNDNCQSVETYYSGDDYRNIGRDREDVSDYLKDFANWIYRQLEKEYEYQNSDEQVTESIIANEYEFTEQGEIV